MSNINGMNGMNEELIKELRDQEDRNSRYSKALIGLMQAYTNLKGEDEQLDNFLLAIMQEFSTRIDLSDKKIDADDINNIIHKINNNETPLLNSEVNGYLENLFKDQ